MARTGGLLAGLTARGRWFLVIGLLVVVVGLASGQADIAHIAAFLLLAPVVAALVVRRTWVTLSASRELLPARVVAGAGSRVSITVANDSRIPSGRLFFEDRLPYHLGGSPRFCVESLAGLARQSVSYTLRCELRGRYPIGPLSVRVSDPFGLCQLRREFPEPHELLVLPPVVPLPHLALGGDWAGEGEHRPRRFAAAGQDDVTTRSYRLGDDLRRVHWRTTARLGELAVRREDQPWQSRAVLLLDTRSGAHVGTGRDSSFEYAVSALASVGVHLEQRGFGVRALTDAAAPLRAPGGLLDALTTVTPSQGDVLAPGIAALRAGGGESVAVLVVGRLREEDVRGIARCRHLVGHGVILALETASWLPPDPLPDTTAAEPLDERHFRLLRDAGWQVVRARRGEDLAKAWARAARSAPAPARAPAPAPAGGPR